MNSKKDLTELDIITRFIILTLEKAGWDIGKHSREEVYFIAGGFKGSV